mgnify:CR=1 FL=1
MTKAKKPTPKKLCIKLVHSAIGYSEEHKATLRALGLRRINQSVVQVDTPALQGMLRKVSHLVHVEEQVD